MAKPVLGAVWAQAENGVIGRAGDMPWYAPEDLAHFKALTLGAPVVMGRKTWESFPPRFRPLPGRTNLVVSSSVTQKTEQDGAVWVPSLVQALEVAEEQKPPVIWIIGGGSIYAAAFELTDLPGIVGGRVSQVERTVFGVSLPGDTFAPALPADFQLTGKGATGISAKGYGLDETGEKLPLPYRFETWQLHM